MRKEEFTCVGHSVPKVDALDKVLGRALYSEDISFPNMLYGRVLRAGIPHARVKTIDTSKAQSMVGVACVLTAKDIPGNNRFGLYFQDQCALAEDKVRYIGDPVAILAAESDEIAREAIKAIEVTYHELPAVTGVHEALTEEAPKIHEKGNLLQHNKICKGDIDEGFQFADIVVVCDDGSSDMTSDMAERLGAVVVKHDENKGYGAAIQSLFRAAKRLDADVFVTLDGDGQHDADEIHTVMKPILENKADISIGSRFIDGNNNDVPLYRRFGIWVLTRFTNAGSKEDHHRVMDGQSGFRAYSKNW